MCASATACAVRRHRTARRGEELYAVSHRVAYDIGPLRRSFCETRGYIFQSRPLLARLCESINRIMRIAFYTPRTTHLDHHYANATARTDARTRATPTGLWSAASNFAALPAAVAARKCSYESGVSTYWLAPLEPAVASSGLARALRPRAVGRPLAIAPPFTCSFCRPAPYQPCSPRSRSQRIGTIHSAAAWSASRRWRPRACAARRAASPSTS